MRLRVVKRAKWCVLTPVGEDGRCALFEFLASLSGEMAQDAKRIERRFRVLSEEGSIRNEEKARAIEGADGIFEVKGKHVRAFYFNYSGYRIVCSHGVKKPKKSQVLVEAAKAERLRLDVAKAEREGRLEIEEES